MSNYGIKATKKNQDTGSNNIKDFNIHSNYNILKIAKEGTGKVDGTWQDYGMFGLFKYKEITHNLGYKPQVLFYFQHPDNNRWYWASTRAETDDFNISGSIKTQDDNTVYLMIGVGQKDMGATLGDINYKYYILIEPRKDAWYE